MSNKTKVIAAIVAVAAIAGVAGSANANHRSMHGFHPHRHLYFYAGPPVRDCTFYREMWEDTGLFKWKKRYFICKGWW